MNQRGRGRSGFHFLRQGPGVQHVWARVIILDRDLGCNGRPLKGLKHMSSFMRFIFWKIILPGKKVWKDTCQTVSAVTSEGLRWGKV